MNCEFCGEAVPPEEVFCPHCGAKVGAPEPEPRFHLEVGDCVFGRREVVAACGVDGPVERYEVVERADGEEVRYSLALEVPEETSREELLTLRPVAEMEAGALDREDTREQPTGALLRQAEVLRRAEQAGVVSAAEFHLTTCGSLLFVPEPGGRSLTDLVTASDRPWTVHQVLRALIPGCEAVAALHSSGVLHLNLNLDTIQRVGQQVQLSNFWRAQMVREAAADQRVTTGFSAPEQYQPGAAPLDERTDVFALGMVLYYLLCGSTEPLPLAEQMWSLPEPSAPGDALRRELYGAAQRATAFHPEDRFASAAQMGAALRALAERRRPLTETRVTYSAATDLGLSRENNEDAILALSQELFDEAGRQYVGVFAVADGMGGHRRGEVASALVVRTLAEQVALEFFPNRLGETSLASAPPADIERFLGQTTALMNELIADVGAQDPTARGLGTTLTAGLLLGEMLFLEHVGDSRAYLWRAGKLERLTKDDSLVQWMVTLGQLSPEEAFGHALSNQLLAALDGKPERQATTSVVEVQRGDTLLFCSDGLSGFLRDAQIAETLAAGGTAAGLTARLVEQVKAVQRADEQLLVQSDNVSVVVVQID